MIATRIAKPATPPTTQSAIKPGLAAKWRAREIESHINIWFKQEKQLIKKTGTDSKVQLIFSRIYLSCALVGRIYPKVQ